MTDREIARAPAPTPAPAPDRNGTPPVSAPTVASVLGNRIVQRLAISRSSDPAERAADRVADRIAGPAAPLPCACGQGHARPPGPVIQRSVAGSNGAAARSGAPTGTRSERLPPDTRSYFERRLGADLRDVTVHTGPQADGAARALGAQAFTVGSDIGFAAGRYDPHSAAGHRLLAHELTHVLQQTGRMGPLVGGTIQRQEQPGATATATGTATAPAPGELVVQAPEPAAPREDTPATPTQGTARLWVGDVMIADDRDYLRGALRRLIASKGLEGADEWYRRLPSWQQTTAAPPLTAHTRALGGRVRSPIDVQRAMQAEQVRNRLLPLVQQVYTEVRADAVAFLQTFETKATEVTKAVLKDSEARIEAERLRYGIERHERRTTSFRRFGGDYFPVEQVSVSYTMEDTVASGGLAGAAADLKAKRDEITQLVIQRNALLEYRSYGQGGTQVTLPEANRPRYEQLGRDIEQRRGEYDVLRATYSDRYPILASFGQDYRTLRTLAGGPSPAVAAVIGQELAEKQRNINQVRHQLRPGGEVKVWKLPEIVALTKAATHAVPGTTLGAMRSRVVDDKVQQVKDEEFWRNLALAVLAIGLALLAAIPTGGSSLAAGVAAVAAIGSAGLSIYSAARHLQEYSLEKAMAGTDFDRARAISATEPSLFWLAVDVVGAVLDVGPGIKAARTAITATKRTFDALAPLARRAISASGPDAATALANLRRAAEATPGGASLASRVAANVERLRTARGDVRQLARAAGHEAEAVSRATAKVTREAADSLASVPSRLGAHQVRVTPSGMVVRCTSCGILRLEYAVELSRHPELARRWFDIDELAKRAAAAGDRKLAKQAAEQARALADELEAARRIQEVRVYRGLRAGAVDDVFLMDRRLVVDMPFVGRGASNVNSAGWLRDAGHYWREMVRRHPDAFSPDNLRRIRGDPPLAGPVSPVNDATFRGVFTQYDVRGMRGKPLIHHHIAGGGQAAAIPSPLHPGSGGIHNVEKAAGIWGAEDPIADVLQRLLEKSGGGTP